MADGHAAERRCGQRSAQRARTQARRRLGSRGATARAATCARRFGPPALIRQPGRLRVRVGERRTLRSSSTPARRRGACSSRRSRPRERSLPGHSTARWFRQPQNRGIFGRRRGGRRRFARGGDDESHRWISAPERGALQRPDDRARVLRQFHASGTGGTWLIVTTVVHDTAYLTQEFVISSQFRKDPDGSRWNPSPCDIPPPRAPRRG